MSINELEGRELDGFIHTEIMGYRLKGYGIWVPKYSRDYAAALPLIEDETDYEIEKAGDNYHVFLPGKMAKGSGKTLPLAICRALMAAEAE